MEKYSSKLANTPMFLLETGVIPSNSIANCLRAVSEERYQVSPDRDHSISYLEDYPNPKNQTLRISWKFQEAKFKNGFQIEPEPDSYTHEARDWFFANKNERLYVTNSGGVALLKGKEIFVSEIQGKQDTTRVLLKDLAYPALMKALEAGLTNQQLRKGLVYNIGQYKVHALGYGMSRTGNIKFLMELETPEGKKLPLDHKILNQLKFEKLTSTVLYGVKDIIQEYEKTIKEGQSPEVAILIARSGGGEDVKRRVAFVQAHPELNISIESAVYPCWADGIIPINKISSSGYDETVIANAIGFIGEPEKPANFSLEYKTTEGEQKPWAIEFSYSTPSGNGEYWLYLNGFSADAHNGNLETMSSNGFFERYRGLLWIFLYPLREKIAEFKKNFC